MNQSTPRAMLVVWLIRLSTHGEAPGGSVPSPLIIVGGGSVGEAVTAKALESAGGDGARVLIVPHASRRPEAGSESADFWRSRGAKHVAVLDLSDAAAARSAVQEATLIWFGGGDQNHLMEALRGAELPDVLRDRHRRGAVVGGTSAGAAVMSGVMLTGGGDKERLARDSTETGEGLGLWPGVIVDQHFLKRGRFNRLLNAVIERPHLVGVGIDEDSAVMASGNRFHVLAGQVVVIDARSAMTPWKHENGFPVALGVRVHVLRTGMTFDLGDLSTPR